MVRFFVLFYALLSFAYSSDKLDPVLRKMLSYGERDFASKSYMSLQKVKVLRSDGKVELVDLSNTDIKHLQMDQKVLYIEAPKKLRLLDDISSNSSYVLWGRGNTSVSVSYNKPFYGYIFGGNVSGQGCTQSSIFFQCSSATDLSITALSDYRLILYAPDMNASDISGGERKYLVGTRASTSQSTGRGVMVGIIDSGINFCHPAFRNPDGTTRVLFYKDHTGIEFNEAQINDRINIGNCNYDNEGHGTAVAGIAGGYWSASRYNSVAKDVKFIVYKTNLYDTDVMAGLDYIKSKAQSLGMPVVVNLSLGGHSGPHDGTGLLDRYIDQLSGPGFIVVVSAGNEGSDRIHARLTSDMGNIHMSVSSSVAIDGWYTRGASYRVRVCDETGINCIGAEPGNLSQGQVSTTSCYVYIDNRTLSSPLNGDGEIYAEVSCLSQTNLILRLTRLSGGGTVDLWMSGDGEFTDGQVSDGFGGFSYTVSSPGTARSVITVGAIGASYISQSRFDNYGRIAFFSSRGPTRDGRIKPDVVAEGFFQCTANPNFSGSTDPNLCGPPGSGAYYMAIGGTSFSAPVVTSLVAIYLQSHPSADPSQIKNWLTSNAFYDTEGTPPNVAYGYGKAVWKDSASATSPQSSGGGGGCSMVSSSPSSVLPYAFLMLLVLIKKLRRLQCLTFQHVLTRLPTRRG
ncbi:S8 family serine peptidase [Hydrogenobacter thermophilus]|uniref:S8 family serine peptidase n=1 Tax=Hydrogenobacter thermophilus TaxID=940 RepID=UPI0030FBDC07